MEKISIRKNIKESFELYKKNYKILLITALLFVLISSMNNLDNPLLSLIAFVAGIILQMGFIKISLDILDGEKPTLSTLWSQKDKFLKYFLMIVFLAVIVSAPIILVSLGIMFFAPALLVPVLMSIFIILTFFLVIPRFMFANLIIVDTDESAWGSIKTSYFLTKDNILKLIQLLLVVMIINILGVLALVVGLLFTIPLSQLLIAKFYRDMSGKLMPVTEEDAPKDIVEVENTPAE